MPSVTVTYVVLTAAILGLVFSMVPVASLFVSAQHLPAVQVELRNLAFMVEEQAVVTCEASGIAHADVQTRITMPRSIFGNAYTITISSSQLVAQSGNIKFTTHLPTLPSVVWVDGSYKSGGTSLLIVARYDAVTTQTSVTISN